MTAPWNIQMAADQGAQLARDRGRALKFGSAADDLELWTATLDRNRKHARRQGYSPVVPADARRVWRTEESIGIVQDAWSLRPDRLMLDLSVPHWQSEPDVLVGLRMLRALETSIIVGDEMESKTPAAIFVETPSQQRREPQLVVAEREVKVMVNHSRVLLATLAVMPLLIAVIAFAVVGGRIPWLPGLGAFGMSVALLATAVLQIRADRRRLPPASSVQQGLPGGSVA